MKCENCGNDYDRALTINVDGESHVFDCFECAVETLAPRCNNCNTHVLGHGLQAASDIYCCVHCAEAQGVSGFVDRV